MQDLDGDLVTIGAFDEALIVTSGLLVGDPARLLGIVGLGLELELKLGRDQQPRRRIGIGSVGLLHVAGHVGLGLLSCVNWKKIHNSKWN